MQPASQVAKGAKWLVDELGLKTMLSAGKDVYIIILSRYLRLFAYGAVALVLALYFEALDFSDEQIGLFMTLTLLGDTVISLLLTLVADGLGRRKTLLLGAFMMAVSGAVFATTSNYIALLIAAIVGVISPSGNEIGPFRAIEESTMAHLVPEAKRSDVFTWYVVMAVLGTSTGLAVGGVAFDKFLALDGWTQVDAYRMIFWIYTAVGCVKGIMTLFLSAECEPKKPRLVQVRDRPTESDETEPLLQNGQSEEGAVTPKPEKRRNPFTTLSKPSRVILLKLCSLFFFDSLGSGMVPFSLINFYMSRKFNLEKGKLGGIMSATWFVSTLGTVFAASLAKRIGLIQAMVVTHLPASLFLALLPIPPGLPLTICLLVGRSILSSMDQAPRSAFLSLVVLPEERTAVMGIVNIIKTLAQSTGPSVTGVLAGHNHFWVAFVVAGSMKAAYDVALLIFFAGRVHKSREGTQHSDDDEDDSLGSALAEQHPIIAEDGIGVQQEDTALKLPSALDVSQGVAGPTGFRPTIFAAAGNKRTLGWGFGWLNFALFLDHPDTAFSTMAPAVLTTPGKILYLDAYDSFSNNIVSQIEQSVGANVVSIRIDDPCFTRKSEEGTIVSDSGLFVEYLKGFDAAIAGPGPGWANVNDDVGLMQELWKLQGEDMLPVLGICLGFQSLALNFGADIERLPEPRHGLISEVLHKGQSIFRDVGHLLATQYHSLQVNIGHTIQTKRAVKYPKQLWTPTEKCPQLEPLAWDFEEKKNGAVLMGLRHINKPFWGVQFHPESICTNGEGTRIVQNWWIEAQIWNHARKRTLVQHLERDDQKLSPPDSDTEQLTPSPTGAKQTPTCHPLNFAFEMTHDGLPPAIVHCLTTGSGRLTVQDLCQYFDINETEGIVLQSGLQSDLLPLQVGTGRYSIIGLIIPEETLRLHYYTGSKKLQLRKGNNDVVLESEVEDVWSYVRAIMQYLRPGLQPVGPTFAPFWGGLMGYVSYEAGLESIGVEACPADEGKPVIPDMCFAFITRSIVFDHQVKKIYVQSIRSMEDRAWVLDALDIIDDAVGQKSATSTPSIIYRADPFEVYVPPVNGFVGSCKRSVVSHGSYHKSITRCQDFIRDGHSYELCLTAQNTITGSTPASCTTPKSSNQMSWDLYKRLTSRNPAPFSAYIRLHNLHILSSSPERYISWSRTGVAQCRPIKGTVSKANGATAADAISILSSPKERAENLMIVDLTRHQLHGVYGSGNVQVTKLMEIEEYETLWQLVSVIEAVPPGISKARTPEEWEEPADYVSMKKSAKLGEVNLGFEAFVRSLPPGSMTGAPKKRSCEILKQLEGRRRGIYSGVLGYLDVGGGGDFSVVIRTAVKVDREEGEDEGEDAGEDAGEDGGKEIWTIGAGGAITSQSVLDSEYEEMKGKFWSTGRAFMD
ncbi:para-aminobenzoate synthase [Amniculicola lignicola CBS 123094]|uniref:p-aminobenzoic acid synthase n=1 Tax=Amniculicola lignicola CBS 123094 TaxID=1392246 RepID=A0A6A5WXY7_9PLEO|nr:para-aminobenzoate synthase [Amniculicola lignicola CBS 123094]